VILHKLSGSPRLRFDGLGPRVYARLERSKAAGTAGLTRPRKNAEIPDFVCTTEAGGVSTEKVAPVAPLRWNFATVPHTVISCPPQRLCVLGPRLCGGPPEIPALASFRARCGDIGLVRRPIEDSRELGHGWMVAPGG
jgi:hypothetical protein